MNLETLLSQQGLVNQNPGIENIRRRAHFIKEPIKLFYGETYDSEGHPIDSLKYYFFVSMLSKKLKEERFETKPEILIADVAACRNVSASLNYTYLDLGEERKQFANTAKKIYGLDINVIKMGDYLFTQEFKDELKEIISICKNNSELMKKIEMTVPESKLEIERKKGFAYSFDEIGTIIGLDVKVGPPREDLYDNVAREIAHIQGRRQLMSLFLTPTFPLAKSWAYFFSNEGIENNGITAYKVGSKQLQDHRIIIGKTTPTEAERLIKNSFVSPNIKLPNPVLDIGIIAEMARICLEGGEFNLVERYSSGKLTTEELKREVIDNINKYIIGKF